MLYANVSKDILDLVASIAPRIISATQRCQAAAVNSANATTTRTYVASVIAIRIAVIASSVYSIPMVPLAKCAKKDSTETLCGRIVKTVDAIFWAPTRARATIVPDSVRVYRTS